MDNMETRKTEWMGEVLLLGLLGKILYQEPDKDWLNTLISEEVFSEVPFGQGQSDVESGLQLLQQWTRENRDGLTQKAYEDIQRDHLYLLVGVGTTLVPAWESVYFSEARLLFQEQTLQVRDWYARFGLEFERKGREPEDQIGLELSFTAHLAGLALQSLEQGDLETYEKALQAQREFLSQHLLRWVFTWAELMQKYASTDFYQGLAKLTKGALLVVAERLQLAVPKAVER